MDEQTITEPVTTTPEPVVLDTPAVEPAQAEPDQTPAEPLATAETPQIEPLSEPLPSDPEPPTPQLPADEALPETVPEPTPQGAVAQAEAPKLRTPTPSPTTPGTRTMCRWHSGPSAARRTGSPRPGTRI